MIIAVIPARGGSKRVPRKNVKDFCGRPMIAWSIDAALKSGCFDRVIVSTDDDEIREVAVSCGADVPFRRPPDLSDDFTPTVPVVAHAIRWQQQTAPVERACCIYATAPFIQAEDLRAGLTLLAEEAADYAFAATTFEFPVQRAIRIDGRGHVSMFQPKHMLTRSQDLEPAFHDAGQFYWGRADAWLAGRPIFGPRSVALALERQRVQDIDTIEDWDRAELIFNALRARSKKGNA
ncbi:pseudaminic acid cytidylyltransferase [Brevundimonas basaltis]|uniref:N-acylneuraminate cytidylyltransferase n=1 Tax=Brevundimonas basaltis TaxID=472166 RepID=A0A7W8I171_9CAUL|nr:pseudaminic acid cytidylyltransferase [Brevundimonas basaltis]MBB5292637.1 N-acylneuraminate cytidylyltransferase [Brevundimonas basaltis]